MTRMDAMARGERARVFRAVGLWTAVIMTVTLSAVLVTQPATAPRILPVIAVVDASILLGLALNHRGHTTLASWLYLGTALAVLTFRAWTAGGIHSYGVQAYFIFVLIAGLVLGHRGGVYFALIAAALASLPHPQRPTSDSPQLPTIWDTLGSWGRG